MPRVLQGSTCTYKKAAPFTNYCSNTCLRRAPFPNRVRGPGPGTSVGKISDMNSEQSDCLRKIVINEPMPELSLTSKRVKEQEEGSKGEEKIGKKKNDKEDTAEFDSSIEHLRVIAKELESSNFENIREVLGMEPSVHVECAVSTVIAMTGLVRSEGEMPSNCRKFYKERTLRTLLTNY